jgi:hypothetical protein
VVAAPKSGMMIKENNRNLQRKKERTQPGRFVQERNQTGGGVVLKMTIVKMRVKRDQLPYFPFLMREKRDQLPNFPFLIESLFFNFFIQ